MICIGSEVRVNTPSSVIEGRVIAGMDFDGAQLTISSAGIEIELDGSFTVLCDDGARFRIKGWQFTSDDIEEL